MSTKATAKQIVYNKVFYLVVEKRGHNARRTYCIWITANIEITNLPLSTTPSAAKLWLFWLALEPALLFKKFIVSGCTRSNGQRISKRIYSLSDINPAFFILFTFVHQLKQVNCAKKLITFSTIFSNANINCALSQS